VKETRLIKPPFHLSLDEYLKGIDREADDLDLIDEVESSFNELLINRAYNHDPEANYPIITFCTPHTPNFKPVDNNVIIPWPRSDAMNGKYHYRKTNNGVIVLGCRGGIEAFYVDAVVSVAEEHRSCGLGTEIIIIASLLHEENPAWAKNKPQYSPAGLRAHKRAWNAYRRHHDKFSMKVIELNE
jgi:hypothetical protein